MLSTLAEVKTLSTISSDTHNKEAAPLRADEERKQKTKQTTTEKKKWSEVESEVR